MNTVPNKPKTKTRGVRVPDDEWHAAQAKAEECGETVTDVIRRALRDYVDPNTSKRVRALIDAEVAAAEALEEEFAKKVSQRIAGVIKREMGER